jgi:transposase
MLTREEILEIYEAGSEAVISEIQRLDIIIKEQAIQINELEERVNILESRLNQDSHNSSKPPSTDFFVKKNTNFKSRRKKSDKNPGGQEGHPGTTLEMSTNPDEVIEHPIDCCKECGHSLEDVEAEAYERRQIFDIPPVNLIVTEHRSQIKICPHCGRLNKADFPELVKYPVQYGPNILTSAIYCKNYQFIPYERISEFYKDVMGIKICSATIIRAERECFKNLDKFENVIREKLITSHVIHCDETGMKIKKEGYWLHVASNDKYTCYLVHQKRGSEATDAMEILPKFKGIAVHDGFKSYNKYECDHALCNAHLQRELTGIEENYKQQWAKEMNELLTEMKKYTDECKEQIQELDPERIKVLEKRFDVIVTKGIEENPPSQNPQRKGKRGVSPKTKARNLLDRFIEHKEKILRFLRDLRVPFENNQAERDIRMMKLQQKISGTFRTTRGAEAFCRIRAYISTIKKNGLPVLEGILTALQGTPLTIP